MMLALALSAVAVGADCVPGCVAAERCVAGLCVPSDGPGRLCVVRERERSTSQILGRIRDESAEQPMSDVLEDRTFDPHGVMKTRGLTLSATETAHEEVELGGPLRVLLSPDRYLCWWVDAGPRRVSATGYARGGVRVFQSWTELTNRFPSIRHTVEIDVPSAQEVWLQLGIAPADRPGGQPTLTAVDREVGSRAMGRLHTPESSHIAPDLPTQIVRRLSERPLDVSVPLRLDFGRVPPGVTDQMGVVVGNTGHRRLELQRAFTVGGPFRLHGDAVSVLGPGLSAEVSVAYQPMASGEHAGAVVLRFLQGAVVIPVYGHTPDVEPSQGRGPKPVEPATVGGAPDLDVCFHRERGRLPGLRGRVVTQVDVDGTGGVIRAMLERTTMGAGDVESCVIAGLEAARFTPQPTGPVRVEMVFAFGY